MQQRTESALLDSPQLVVKRYNSNGKTFVHCLICSTAPKNVENPRLEALLPNYSASLQYLDEIKQALKHFIEAQWHDSGKDVLKKISIILDIHGYNVPIEKLEKDTYEPLAKKFVSDTRGQDFDDFVLFVNFAWPSERAINSQWLDLFRAMPLMLWILLIGAIALTGLFWHTLFSALGLVLIGLALCFVFLRLAVYFRDRDRASSYGVFDAVELVRWLHVILEEILDQKQGNSLEKSERLKLEFFGTANLSFIAHSMGCFVATQTIRVLSDVFDSAATQRWKNLASEGPFGGTKIQHSPEHEKIEALRKIGDLLSLKSLVLASPDIPIWAITTGRSNFLRTCLRRFEEAYLFTNDADMVLRLASTVANYFVFPSKSRIGGYRLGNLTCTEPRSYGVTNLDATGLGIRAFSRNINLTEPPFASSEKPVASSENKLYQAFTIADCTDYRDQLVTESAAARSKLIGRRLSVLTANNSAANFLNYLLTAISHFLGIGQIDSHGGYFRGKFCLDLLYALALYKKEIAQGKLEVGYGAKWSQLLREYQIAWIQTKDSN